MLLLIGYCSSEHYSSETLFTSRNCCSREGMEAKSFEEGLAEARQDFSLARQDFTLASEKFHKSIKAAIKKEINQEGQVDFLGVQLNQRSPNRKGDPLSPFLFILVMESLHLSFQKVVNAGLYKGVVLDNSLQISHLFYADDVVFIGQWCDSNISTIIRVLDCFFQRINLHKSKIMGIAFDNSLVTQAANSIGCLTLSPLFQYLGVNIGSHMSRIKSWDIVLNKVQGRLSKWKLKDKGGMGVSSFFALNRALIFKWIWRFHSQGFSLWSRVIKAIHGVDGKLGYHIKPSASSNWIDIVRTLSILLNKGIDLLGYIKKKVGNGEKTLFWYEPWKGDVSFNNLFPRLFALELDKKISVAGKMAQPSLITSFRRNPRSGTEASQMAMLTSLLEGICLPNMLDRWCWSLSGDEEFSVSSARILIDDKTLGTVGSKTHWCKYVPLKVNILSWRVKLNNLPTRLNLSRRGMDIQSILCPSCNLAVESTNHIFFSCPMMKDLYKSISRWWDVNLLNLSSYDDWWEWFSSLRLSSKLKLLMEGVFKKKVKAWCASKGTIPYFETSAKEGTNVEAAFQCIATNALKNEPEEENGNRVQATVRNKKISKFQLLMKVHVTESPIFPASPTDFEYLRSGMRYMIHNEVACLMLGRNPIRNRLKLKVKVKLMAMERINKFIPKPKNPKPSAKEHPSKDDTCHHCKEVGHCKRNCPAYLAELIKKKNTKRVKHYLDSIYLWHYRLAYISKKRIEKLQQEGLLKSTDDESFDQCLSCLSGKMTRKFFSHHPKRATDLLGIIHTNVCGPLKHVSRQGASYFITFMNDYSRYGYVYLLKHKYKVFETFKVFKNEVENQLGKAIKALRSDRGGEYISQEFKDYLKACGIVQQLTPPYTPQHNGVSERRNHTLLDMV
ncbi:RNA-directed DNA polymerase, eukaryota, reverse transcriptase zinc-binding domain protein [Tanacetum coccineum]